MRILLITIFMSFVIMFAVTAHAREITEAVSNSQNIESMYDTEEDEESYTDAPEVPVTHNLLTLASESRQREVPILIMFSAEDCDFCERLEEDVVRPMLLSGEFDRRAIFRKVMIDSTEQLRDFRGSERDPEEYADKLNVQVTPTLMFVDSKGKELVPKVIGYQTGGLFMAYLNLAIDASQQTLKRP